MSSPTAPDRVLQETMGRLENALLAPPVAGELGNWVCAVTQAATTLATDWARERHSILGPQYEQIALADAELLTRVEQLQATDEELSQDLVRFYEGLHQLAQATAHVDWDESKLAALQKRVEDHGIQLILKMKKQQTAAATWLAEALYRDRGTKD